MNRLICFVVFASILGSSPATAQGPQPVSPGGETAEALISERCPTFLWTSVAGAEKVNLVVFRVPEAESDGPPGRVLSVELPGSASGWTPSLGRCLEAGRQYAWSVGVDGEWSEASWFRVASAPPIPEVERAIEVLREYQAAGPAAVLQEPKAETRPAPAPATRDRSLRRKPLDASPAQAPPALADPSLVLESHLSLAIDAAILKAGDLWAWDDSAANTAFGTGALTSTTGGGGNTGFGYDALYANTAGSYNTAVGYLALSSNQASYNTAVGALALYYNNTGLHNIAIGDSALYSNHNGDYNIAIGNEALVDNNEGNNLAIGQRALAANTTGNRNLAIGTRALSENIGGGDNVAVGYHALKEATVTGATAVGFSALAANTTGGFNTALGANSLGANVSGSYNVAIGYRAGSMVTDGGYNIFIGDVGANESYTIRIGTQGTQQKAFVAGIFGNSTVGASYVHVTAAGQLVQGGAVSSSLRFKEDVRDIGLASDGLLKLRPVSFRFKQSHAGADPGLQYGFIAEEVAEIYPALVRRDDQGRPVAIRYSSLTPLLLKELQKQHRQNRVQWLLMGGMLLVSLALTVGRWRLG